jgi:hypothetical protein
MLFLAFFAFASCAKRVINVKPVEVFEIVPEELAEMEDVILENNFLHLRFLPKTAAIILTDKDTGMQWHSNPKGDAADTLADFVTTNLMESQLALEYSDTTGVGMTLYSSQSSVAIHAYSFEVVNGALEVNYTIGDISRTYRIPPAVPEDRMHLFIDKFDEMDLTYVDAGYRLYDINSLRSTDDRATLLSMYPDLNRTKIYVVRNDIPDYMKETMEVAFMGAGYTYEDYYDDAMRYPAADSEMNKPAFNITLRYYLDGKSLMLNIPFDKVAYRPKFPLKQLSVLPFMGSGSVDDEGFMLVPDGSGSIINFNNGKQNQLAYGDIVYGWDEAIPREALINDNRAPYPVFGIQKNGRALLCIIEDGASYANIRADVSGRNCSWNRVYAAFDMVHSARMDISGRRTDRAVYMYENGLPLDESITLRYTVCDNPGYVAMAKEYRSWMLNKYPDISRSSAGSGIPVAVEIVGAVNKTQHRLGIPFDLPLKLTSYKETESMINDFAGFGWNNVYLKLNGWFNHSVDHSVPTKLKLIKELGSKKDFKKIIAAAEQKNMKLYPDADFFYIRDVKRFSGFSIYRDAARYANRERIQKYPFSFVWFGERTQWGKLSYVSRPSSMMKMIDKFVPKAKALGVKNLSLRNIGSRLAGDYHEKRRVSREASMRMRQEKLSQLKAGGTGIMINGGFAYTAPFADMITDMALEDQYFGITDYSVPFYPVALRGIVPFTGKAINLAEDYSRNLLKTIESGAGLYYSFMKEETSELQETKFRQFYANEYDKWKDDANKLYQQFNRDFGHLYNRDIEDHIVLAQDIAVTVYDDGTRVLVNATNYPWDYNGRVINANSYIVLRQGE